MSQNDLGPIRDMRFRIQFRNEWSATIEEGLRSLNRALELDSGYADAMSYVNLLLRERAAYADTPEQYSRDMQLADQYVKKAIAIKAGKEESK